MCLWAYFSEELLFENLLPNPVAAKDCWVAECLALTKALEGNFLSRLWKNHPCRAVAAFQNALVEAAFQQPLAGSVFFRFQALSWLHVQLTHPHGLPGPHVLMKISKSSLVSVNCKLQAWAVKTVNKQADGQRGLERLWWGIQDRWREICTTPWLWTRISQISASNKLAVQ